MITQSKLQLRFPLRFRNTLKFARFRKLLRPGPLCIRLPAEILCLIICACIQPFDLVITFDIPSPHFMRTIVPNFWNYPIKLVNRFFYEETWVGLFTKFSGHLVLGRHCNDDSSHERGSVRSLIRRANRELGYTGMDISIISPLFPLVREIRWLSNHNSPLKDLCLAPLVSLRSIYLEHGYISQDQTVNCTLEDALAGRLDQRLVSSIIRELQSSRPKHRRLPQIPSPQQKIAIFRIYSFVFGEDPSIGMDFQAEFACVHRVRIVGHYQEGKLVERSHMEWNMCEGRCTSTECWTFNI